MNRSVLKAVVCAVIAMPVFCSGSESAQTVTHLQRHWKETDSETLWTVRYNNCDYGYYVLLPDGVVGHDTLPPSPNHGFRVSLPDVGTTSYVLGQNERFIWVDASYSDAKSVTDVVGERQMSDPTRKTERIATQLGSLPAVQVKSQFPSGKGVVEEETVALRAGIIYTVGMRTFATNLAVDEREYLRIMQGFRLLRLPKGECSNG